MKYKDIRRYNPDSILYNDYLLHTKQAHIKTCPTGGYFIAAITNGGKLWTKFTDDPIYALHFVTVVVTNNGRNCGYEPIMIPVDD